MSRKLGLGKNIEKKAGWRVHKSFPPSNGNLSYAMVKKLMKSQPQLLSKNAFSMLWEVVICGTMLPYVLRLAFPLPLCLGSRWEPSGTSSAASSRTSLEPRAASASASGRSIAVPLMRPSASSSRATASERQHLNTLDVTEEECENAALATACFLPLR